MAGVEVSIQKFSLLSGPTNSIHRPRGIHVNPERWNKIMRHERQSSFSDEDSESDEFSSREASPEHLTPKSLVDEADIPAQKPSNNTQSLADSNADVLDGEAEYLASEEEEYEVDPFGHDPSDGLSSEDASSDVVCKTEIRDADYVKNEIKSDEVLTSKIETDERARYNNWNCDGFSNPFAYKLPSSQAPDQVYSRPIHVRATPFGQKVLNAMRQSRADLESHTSNITGETLTPQSLYERPSSPSDAALFKATTHVPMTKPETFRASFIQEESVKSPTSEEESNYSCCVPTFPRRGSSQAYSMIPPSVVPPESMNVPQSCYQAPFPVSTYRECGESFAHKSEDFDPFGYGAYPPLNRPTPLMAGGHRMYSNVCSQQYPPSEVGASNNVLSQPYWRNSYGSGNSSSQPPTLPTRVTENAEPFLTNNPPSSKPTVLTISEIVSDNNPGLPSEAVHGTKRKVDDMVEDEFNGYQEAALDVSGNEAATSSATYNNDQSRNDPMVMDAVKQSTPEATAETSGMQPYSTERTPEAPIPKAVAPKAMAHNEGPPTKKARIEPPSSMLKSTRTFVSGMLAGGLSVFGALLVYGATAPDSIQDRVRLEFA